MRGAWAKLQKENNRKTGKAPNIFEYEPHIDEIRKKEVCSSGVTSDVSKPSESKSSSYEILKCKIQLKVRSTVIMKNMNLSIAKYIKKYHK